jgi:CRP/FNR family cyclic AMP-dependent transcriptional regulator
LSQRTGQPYALRRRTRAVATFTRRQPDRNQPCRYGRPVDRTRLVGLRFNAGHPEHELDAVARVTSELEFPAGKALATEGEFGHAVFVIEAGSAEVSSGGTSIGRVGPGDIVGEIAVLGSGRRTASVVATSPLRTIAFFKRDVGRSSMRRPRWHAASVRRSRSTSGGSPDSGGSSGCG